MKTLLLDNSAWDLVLDAKGDIALADNPYAIAQDVSSAIRTFLGECWYDTTKGIPYWQEIMGKYPPIGFMRKKIEEVALTIPEVAESQVIFVSFTDRELTGQVKIIDISGKAQGVSF